MLAADTRVRVPSAPLTDTPVAAGPLTFLGHRGAYQATRKAAGSYRVVFVGDSMIYGQGIPASQTLGPRLARHLNTARPGLYVEAITIGLPGGCLFSALGRALTHAAHLEPDLVVLTACCNDAYMLRPQPSSLAAIGQTWLAFTPHLQTAFASFLAAWPAAGAAPVALLYLDRLSTYGTVCASDLLATLAAANGLPFFDASPLLAEYSSEHLTVSSVDGHLNAFAHDVVARHLARTMLQAGWVPEAPDFGDAGWLDSMRTLASALQDAGVPRMMAAARALSVLDAKWTDRRNRNRLAMQSHYDAVRRMLSEPLQDGLTADAWAAAYRLLREKAEPETTLADQDALLYDLNAAFYALEHLARTGDLQQDLSEFLCLDNAPAQDASPDLQALVPTLRERASSHRSPMRRLLTEVAGLSGPDADGLRVYAARVDQWIAGYIASLDRLAAILPTLDTAQPGANRLLTYVAGVLPHIAQALDRVAAALPWDEVPPAVRGLTCEIASMTVELSAAASPGEEQWCFRVGGDSIAPAWHEHYLDARTLIRDGQPHTYTIEIPFTLLATLRLIFFGRGLERQADRTGPLRLGPARVVVPGREPFRVNTPPRLVHQTTKGLTVDYRAVSALECFSR